MEKRKEISDQIDNYKKNLNDSQEIRQKFFDEFLNSKNVVMFNVFVEKFLTEKEESLRRDIMMEMLQDLVFKDPFLEDMIYSFVETDESVNNQELIGFLNILVSLSELISNLFEKNCPRQFYLNNYISRLCQVMNKVINRTYNAKVFDVNGSLIPIHFMFRRLCMKGFQEIVFENLINPILNLINEDNNWQIVARKIIFPDPNSPLLSNESSFHHLEPVLKMIIYHSSSPKSIEKIFSSDFLKMSNNKSLLSNMEFILTNKFVLIFHCPLDLKQENHDQFIFNLLGYLYLSNWNWFQIALQNILDMWSNSTAFNHRSYSQHFYLCRMIIIAARFLLDLPTPFNHGEVNKQSRITLIEKLQQAAFTGATVNLGCSHSELRSIGHTTSLVLFEHLLSFQKIEIEIPDFKELEDFLSNEDDCSHLKLLGTLDLKDILNRTKSNKFNNISNQTNDEISKNISENMVTSQIPVKSDNIPDSSPLDSDDDDDLQPYDMSNDIPVEDDIRITKKDLSQKEIIKEPEQIQKYLLIDNSKQRPIYLQDCIEGLQNPDKRDWMEKCLVSAERIIRANSIMLHDNKSQINRLDSVAQKFVEVLFHLDDQNSIANFDKLRLHSLIALCSGSPKIVANYLTKQFYAPQINVRNRLECLTVLVEASEELSKLVPIEFKGEDKIKAIQQQNFSKKSQFLKEFFDDQSDDEEVPDWQTVIAKRIQSKTRYITQSNKSIDSDASTMASNRFVPIAKYFFYPLLRNDFLKQMDTIHLRIEQDDSILIEMLIYALGVFVKNCQFHSQVMLMSKELLTFLYSFRKHPRRNVRSAIIQTFSTILLNTPKHFLLNDVFDKLGEFSFWLKEVLFEDSDERLIQEAYMALNSFQKLIPKPEDSSMPSIIESK